MKNSTARQHGSSNRTVNTKFSNLFFSPSKRHKIKKSYDIIIVSLLNIFLSDDYLTDCGCC